MKQASSNLKQVKQLNVELTKHTLIRMGPSTKLAVSRETGLSIATCGSILNELLETGEVVECGVTDSNGGRPAALFQYNANCRHIACIVLLHENGTPSIRTAVYNMMAELQTENVLSPKAITVDTLHELVESLHRQDPIIRAVGVSLPGVVGQRDEVGYCDIEGLAGQPLGELLRKRHTGLEFAIENDTNLIALGYYCKQAEAADSRCLVVVDFPRECCAGSGLVIDGNIMKGSTNFASEISYLPFLPQEGDRRLTGKGRGELIDCAVLTAVTLIAILNPDTLVFTHQLIGPDMMEEIQAGCAAHIPAAHLPRMQLSGKHHRNCMEGLMHATMKCLHYDSVPLERQG